MVRAGATGCVIITGLMYLARISGLSRLELPLLLGTFIFPAGWRARLVGLIPHAAASIVVFPMLYRFSFAMRRAEPNMLGSVLIGALHWLISGFALWIVGICNPRVEHVAADEAERPGHVAAPGAFARAYGPFTVAAFALGHLMYGATLGAIMAGSVERPRSAEPTSRTRVGSWA